MELSEDVTLINGRSFDEATIPEVRQAIDGGEVGLFIFDADNNVRRDLDCYSDLLADRCWVIIDDYLGPAKAAPIRAQVDALVSEGRLPHLGITDGVPGSASGSAHSFAAGRSIEKNPIMASTIVAQPKVICAVMDEIR